MQQYCPPYNNNPYPKQLYNEGIPPMSACPPPPPPFMYPYPQPNYYNKKRKKRKNKKVESDSDFSVSIISSDSESSASISDSCSESESESVGSGIEHKIAQLKNKITKLEGKKKKEKHKKEDFDPPDYEKHKFDSADNCSTSIESKVCDSIPFPVKRSCPPVKCPSVVTKPCPTKCPSECSSVVSNESSTIPSVCSTPKKDNLIILRVPKKHKIINNGQQACIRIERKKNI